MFEILLFLFENYPQREAAPDRDRLAIKLSAVGFEMDEIEQVLDWLVELADIPTDPYPINLIESNGLRYYSEHEMRVLDVGSRGFLLFLQQSGVINVLQREWIIDRAIILSSDDNLPDKIRWMAWMVLWSRHPDQNFLPLENMIFNHHAALSLH